MSWEKYGSPYDPNYRGKMQRPVERREQERRERERRQHQLRGCLDPACAWCNPESAAAGGVPGSTPVPGRSNSFAEIRVDVSSVDFASAAVDLGAYATSMREQMLRALNGRKETSKGTEPPASYAKARKEVEKWIARAPAQAFGDIVGNDEALAQLRDAIEAPVRHKALYDAYGMKMPKGALLSGPPGCGKTMFARAAAAEMTRLYGDGVEFISIAGSALQSPYVGVTEQHIAAIFAFAREYQAYRGHPLLVFMDEAEVLLPDRTGRVRRVAPWEESQVATFLAEMDGMQESGAFMLLASNRPEVIDQAVLRDGRCDFKITVKRPTQESVEAILRKNFAGILVGEATVEQLVFAAFEALHDPQKVIIEGRAIGIDVEELKLKDLGYRPFLLEHILSGAMAASVPARAKRHAFGRDKATGEAKGVLVEDVLAAVNDLYEENRPLDHAFALEEFKREVLAEIRAKAGGGANDAEHQRSDRRAA